MKNAGLIALLTPLLALGTATTDQRVTLLDRWLSEQVPPLVQAAQALIRPPFERSELEALGNTAVKAAQELKGIFSGVERARIAQTVFSFAVREVTPDALEPYVLPFIESDAVARFIEERFQAIFGPEAQPIAPGTPPVVDASDVEQGGIQ